MTQATQPQRIQNPERIDARAIRDAIAGGQQVLVQFDTLGEPEPLLADLDALAATCGTALTIRIYGYDPRVFDARILRCCRMWPACPSTATGKPFIWKRWASCAT